MFEIDPKYLAYLEANSTEEPSFTFYEFLPLIEKIKYHGDEELIKTVLYSNQPWFELIPIVEELKPFPSILAASIYYLAKVNPRRKRDVIDACYVVDPNLYRKVITTWSITRIIKTYLCLDN
jgi:hypothetical protein